MKLNQGYYGQLKSTFLLKHPVNAEIAKSQARAQTKAEQNLVDRTSFSSTQNLAANILCGSFRCAR